MEKASPAEEKTKKWRKDLEMVVTYELGRCERQLQDRNFDRLEPLVALMQISKMDRLEKEAEQAKATLKKHEKVPEYKKAEEVAEKLRLRKRPMATTMAIGEEGGGKRLPRRVIPKKEGGQITTQALGEEG